MSSKCNTISDCLENLKLIVGNNYTLDKTSNKGLVGDYLQILLGIPRSSECLDFTDGELKAHPLTKKKGDILAPKESVAVTMCNREKLLIETFEESNVYKKLSNTVFVPYLRNESSIVFYNPCLFNTLHPLFHALKEDYELIQKNAKEGIMTGSIGKYLQTRTKGPGHGSTSRAFYLRPKFISEIYLNEFSFA